MLNREDIEAARTKAEVFLKELSAKHCPNFFDNFFNYETLVYFSSVDRPLIEVEEAAKEDFKKASEARIAEYNAGITFHNLDDPSQSEHYPCKFPVNSLVEIPRLPIEANLWMPWGEFAVGDEECEILGATMMRFGQRCRVPGFDPWFKRWGRLIRCSASQLSNFWLFCACRSDLIVRGHSGFLSHLCGDWDMGDDGFDENKPWVDPYHDETGKAESIIDAGSIAFVSSILSLELRSPAAARQFLLSSQKVDGSWGEFTDSTVGNQMATSIAIHALAIQNRQHNTRYAVEAAATWLLGQQEDDGSWIDRTGWGIPLSWQTVLVLDALELASGGRNVTFALPDNLPAEEAAPVAVAVPEIVEPAEDGVWYCPIRARPPRTQSKKPSRTNLNRPGGFGYRGFFVLQKRIAKRNGAVARIEYFTAVESCCFKSVRR